MECSTVRKFMQLRDDIKGIEIIEKDETKIASLKAVGWLEVIDEHPIYKIPEQYLKSETPEIKDGKYYYKYSVQQTPAKALIEYQVQQAKNAGYTVPDLNVILKFDQEILLQYSAMAVTVKTLLDAGIIPSDHPKKLYLKDGSTMTVTASQFMTIMIGYGKAFLDLENAVV